MATTVTQEYQKITTTGTAVALATAQEVAKLYLYAPIGNEFPIHAGSSTVTATGATTDGLILPQGKMSKDLGPCDLAELYINGHAGDGVMYIANYGTSTSGTTVVQATAANLNATTVPAGWTPSAELGVATNVVKASPGTLHCFLIETNGDTNAVVQAYNHASAATNPITPSIVVAGGDLYGGSGPIDVACSNGIVIVVSGTGAVVTAYYS